MTDPAPVAQTFFVDEFIRENFSLDGIITVTDAKHIIARLDDEKPEGVENEAVEQVAFADLILLNKIDLVDEAELLPIETRLHTINPGAKVVRCAHSKVDPKMMIGIQAFDLEKTLEMDPEFLDTEAEHEHDPSVSSTSCRFEGFLNVNKLNRNINRVIRQWGANLFRYKGVIAVAGKEEKYVFQGVGMMFNGDFSDTKWKPMEKRECCFVFIGKDLDMKALENSFKDCQCSEELRFKVGDKVKAKRDSPDSDADGFVSGTVMGLWDSGNPYWTQLDDNEKNDVWGPIDDDDYVRVYDAPTDAYYESLAAEAPAVAPSVQTVQETKLTMVQRIARLEQTIGTNADGSLTKLPERIAALEEMAGSPLKVIVQIIDLCASSGGQAGNSAQKIASLEVEWL